MVVARVADLIEALEQLPLLEPAQRAALNELGSASPDPVSLGQELVRRGWLTSFQCHWLLQSKGSRLLLGSYVLLDEVGDGGMGTVYKARNWKLGQVVALKQILRELAMEPLAVRRFQREIRATAQLHHANIVKAVDADEIDGQLVLVMEFVEGTNLGALVGDQGPLPLQQAYEYVRQAARGLACIHDGGMIHRDIKPTNLLLDKKRQRVKIADLGLARLLEPRQEGGSISRITQEGLMLGSPDYMSPEQSEDPHHVDARADLYSLGCCFYFLLTGQVPFPGGTATERVARHCAELPPPVQRLRAEVPSGVAGMVRRLMAKRPEERFQSAREVDNALTWILGAAADPPAE